MSTSMSPLLLQFLSESRDFVEGIAVRLMRLENDPGDTALLGELFRLVHTLKGNTGLFDFPDMARVLHASEDLMVAARDGRIGFSAELADRLLAALDFTSMLLDAIEADGAAPAGHASTAAELAASLRALAPAAPDALAIAIDTPAAPRPDIADLLGDVPEEARMDCWRHGAALTLVRYQPEPECFFKGEDPFHLARQAPGLVWHALRLLPEEPGAEPDPYRCRLLFTFVSSAAAAELDEHFRYVADQVSMVQAMPGDWAAATGTPDAFALPAEFFTQADAALGGELAALGALCDAMLELQAPNLRSASLLRWLRLAAGSAQPDRALLERLLGELRGDEAPSPSVPAAVPRTEWHTAVLAAQREVLALTDRPVWHAGRVAAAGAALQACCASLGLLDLADETAGATRAALDSGDADALRACAAKAAGLPLDSTAAPAVQEAAFVETLEARTARADAPITTLKVEQAKIDRLMNLIGELVVAKNALPYLAGRAEDQYGMRELAREIKAHSSVVNRISEEMQDAIMQVRMLPVSFIFQRFPRLVRDLSRRLDKQVELVLEGEDTEADKNMIESLADPLIHIVRNSLDHGIESPAERSAAGKNPCGRLSIRAVQEADRVVIEVSDDGRGIDPERIKRKALEKGLIDAQAAERLSDQEAVNLVFAAGFSTAEAVSDLSGRGVGMDVVRASVERVNGSVILSSRPGRGTTLQLALPLSMALTQVMMIRSGGQVFGVPMDLVRETVRVPQANIHAIKGAQAAVLRERIVPLRSLNAMLATGLPQIPNADGEYATLVLRLGGEAVGVLVDDFCGVSDIILKPMSGLLGSLGGYAGSALLGDGSVLMVLNPKELL